MNIYYDKGERSLVVAFADGSAPLFFDVGTIYHSPNFNVKDDKSGGSECPLEYLNRLLAGLPMDSKRGVFQWYVNVHQVLYTTLTSVLDDTISDAITQLLTIPGVSPMDVKEWVIVNIEVPEDIMVSYSKDGEGIYSREKTYIKEEYLDLAVLILYSKLLMPVIGEYMRRMFVKYKGKLGCDPNVVPGIIGKKREPTDSIRPHVELLALEVLYPCLSVLPATDRLLDFIEASMSATSNSLDLVVDRQISTEDIPMYVLAMLMTKRLPGFTLFGFGSNHLASRLTTTIRAILNPGSRVTINLQNDGVLKEVGDDSKGVFDDTYGQYPLSVGQLTMLHYTTKDEYLIRFMAGKVDVEAYHHLVGILNQVDWHLTRFHVDGIISVLGHIVNPVILRHCDTGTLIRLLAMAFLFAYPKFPHIATMLISCPALQYDRTPISDQVTIDRLAPVTQAMLEKQFPLKLKRGGLLIASHLKEVAAAIQYVWVTPQLSLPNIYLQGGEFHIRADFMHVFSEFLCNAPNILHPTIPDGF